MELEGNAACFLATPSSLSEPPPADGGGHVRDAFRTGPPVNK